VNNCSFVGKNVYCTTVSVSERHWAGVAVIEGTIELSGFGPFGGWATLSCPWYCLWISNKAMLFWDFHLRPFEVGPGWHTELSL